MENENNETYVSLETAKLLKQAGFDWEVRFGRHIWDNNDVRDSIIGENFNNNKLIVSLPTLEVAQKWLREVKGYYIAIDWDMNIGYDGSELYDFNKCFASIYVERNHANRCVFVSDYYQTYEEVQEVVINKCLELILENKDELLKSL